MCVFFKHSNHARVCESSIVVSIGHVYAKFPLPVPRNQCPSRPPPPSTLCTLKTLRKRMNSPPWCLVKLRKKNNPLYIYVVHSFQWKWDESVMTSKASQPFRVSVQGGLRWHALIPYLGQNSCYITLVYPVFSPFSGSSAIVLFWEGKLTLS